MHDLRKMAEQFRDSCRKAHEFMSDGDFKRGIRMCDRMLMLRGSLMASGEKGREVLFAMVEGDDLPVAIHAANCMFDHDPARCKRALKSIIRKDSGFFAYAARFMIRHRRKSIDRLLAEMRAQTRRELARCCEARGRLVSLRARSAAQVASGAAQRASAGTRPPSGPRAAGGCRPPKRPAG